MAEFIYKLELLKLNGVLRESIGEMPALFYGLLLGWLLLSYFFGGLNFAIILSKALYHDDIRNHGSGNAGFTNMKRTFGMKVAAFVILGDIMKTVVSVLVGMILFGIDGATLAGLACILGHCFPCLYKFKGGKGVAALAAMLLVLDPLTFLILFAIFALVVFGTKYLSLGSIMAAILYPLIQNRVYNFLHTVVLPSYFVKNGLYTELFTMNGAVTEVAPVVNTLVHSVTPTMTLVGIFLTVFVVVMHRTNIQRIMNGTENRFSLKKNKETVSTAPARSIHSLDELDEELQNEKTDS